MCSCEHRIVGTGFGEAPYGATTFVRGAPKLVARTHVDTAAGAFGVAPYGATKRCPGRGSRMRTAPLGPSLELLMGPRSAAL
eukprot:2026575-Pyramimonas_sp.AAC.1